jgi:hypothetical protein
MAACGLRLKARCMQVRCGWAACQCVWCCVFVDDARGLRAGLGWPGSASVRLRFSPNGNSSSKQQVLAVESRAAVPTQSLCNPPVPHPRRRTVDDGDSAWRVSIAFSWFPLANGQANRGTPSTHPLSLTWPPKIPLPLSFAASEPPTFISPASHRVTARSQLHTTTASTRPPPP